MNMHARDLKKSFWLTFKKDNLPASTFSNRMIIFGLSNGQSEVSVVNMSTPPKLNRLLDHPSQNKISLLTFSQSNHN